MVFPNVLLFFLSFFFKTLNFLLYPAVGLRFFSDQADFFLFRQVLVIGENKKEKPCESASP